MKFIENLEKAKIVLFPQKHKQISRNHIAIARDYTDLIHSALEPIKSKLLHSKDAISKIDIIECPLSLTSVIFYTYSYLRFLL